MAPRIAISPATASVAPAAVITSLLLLLLLLLLWLIVHLRLSAIIALRRVRGGHAVPLPMITSLLLCAVERLLGVE